MRTVQSKVFADSLDPRGPAYAINEDLCDNNVYSCGVGASNKDQIVVDFPHQHDNVPSVLPPGAFPPQNFDVIPP